MVSKERIFKMTLGLRRMQLKSINSFSRNKTNTIFKKKSEINSVFKYVSPPLSQIRYLWIFLSVWQIYLKFLLHIRAFSYFQQLSLIEIFLLIRKVAHYNNIIFLINIFLSNLLLCSLVPFFIRNTEKC